MTKRQERIKKGMQIITDVITEKVTRVESATVRHWILKLFDLMDLEINGIPEEEPTYDAAEEFKKIANL